MHGKFIKLTVAPGGMKESQFCGDEKNTYAQVTFSEEEMHQQLQKGTESSNIPCALIVSNENLY